jgi:outer membrane lipoprotein-sorting protein/mono/diheme cytochrome c family protein
MKFYLIPFAATLALAAAAGYQQPPPQTAVIVTRMSSAYRSLGSYYDVATVKRKINKKDAPATLTIVTQKPNKYMLELKGDYLNTTVLSDGETLISYRPDRKAYTKTKAPVQIIKGDFLGKVDMPSLGARIITQFLSANGREGDVGKFLLNAKLSGPQGFGSKLAYVFRFPYDIVTEAEVYVTTDDYMIRQVRLIKDGTTEWLETHDNIQVDKPVPSDTFTKSLPEGARMVASLPELEKPVEVVEDDAVIKPDTPGNDAAPGEPAPQRETRPSAAQIARGRTAYRSAGCNRCHSINGQGGRIGPDLSNAGADPSHTPTWLAEHISNPRTHNPGSSMPSFAGRISQTDLKALAAYLSSLK